MFLLDWLIPERRRTAAVPTPEIPTQQSSSERASAYYVSEFDEELDRIARLLSTEEAPLGTRFSFPSAEANARIEIYNTTSERVLATVEAFGECGAVDRIAIATIPLPEGCDMREALYELLPGHVKISNF